MKRAMTLIQIMMLSFLFMVLTGFTDGVLIAQTQPDDKSITASEHQLTLYHMYVNDENVGSVRFAARGLSIYDQAVESLKARYDREVFIEGRVHFKKAEITDEEISSESLLVDSIDKAVYIKTSAFAIKIEEQLIAHLATSEEADKLLEMIKQPYRQLVEAKENTWLEEIKIAEQLVIEEEIIFYDQMVGIDEALALITVGVEKAQNYEVQEGDTLWDIAIKYGIEVSDIVLANPVMEEEIIHPGDVLNIMDIRNLTTVITKERHRYTESIDYDTQTRQTNELFVGQSRVVQRGSNGENEVEIYIIRENGQETDREILSDTVITEPVPRIVEQGTKVRPRVVRTTAARGNSRPADLSPISREGVQMMPWFDGVESIFQRGMVVKVTHVNTGLTFYARRYGGRFHADSEPLTPEDTQVLRQIYGGRFSWRREAVLVQIGDRTFAASMNGMPHGGEVIQDNDFQGHFCIHFYGSLVHETGRRDAAHQAMVRYAAGR